MMKSRRMNRRSFLKVAGGFVAASAVLVVERSPILAQGVTKIAPAAGPAGQHFTIVDTPKGRLLPGAAAVFIDGGGTELTAALEANPHCRTACRFVPSTAQPGVTYTVKVRIDGIELVAGTYTVEGFVVAISPTSGIPLTDLTITDSGGRMQSGDDVFFYELGQSPTAGTPATGIVVSGDGKTLTGQMLIVPGGRVYNAAVIPAAGDDPQFSVQYTFGVYPTISPQTGPAGSDFIITDDLMRQQPGDEVVFYVQGMDPATRTATPSISVAGSILEAKVPDGDVGLGHAVNVRAPTTLLVFRFPPAADVRGALGNEAQPCSTLAGGEHVGC